MGKGAVALRFGQPGIDGSQPVIAFRAALAVAAVGAAVRHGSGVAGQFPVIGEGRPFKRQIQTFKAGAVNGSGHDLLLNRG